MELQIGNNIIAGVEAFVRAGTAQDIKGFGLVMIISWLEMNFAAPGVA
jgi:hypothetical protein